MKDLVILGTGNIDIIRLIEDINSEKKEYNIVGFLERNSSLIGKTILGYPIIGDDSLLIEEYSHCSVINNVMSTPQLHHEISQKLITKYHIKSFPNLIHPSFNSRYFNIGYGNIIYERVNIATKVVLGNFNILYPGTNIGHETTIGNSNLFALNVVIGARCTLGNNNQLGNASTISLGVNIENDNAIGVGAVVIKNVTKNENLLGNPAIDSFSLLKEFTRKTIY